MYKLKIFTKKKKNQKEKIIVNLKNLVLENILYSIRNLIIQKKNLFMNMLLMLHINNVLLYWKIIKIKYKDEKVWKL